MYLIGESLLFHHSFNICSFNERATEFGLSRRADKKNLIHGNFFSYKRVA